LKAGSSKRNSHQKTRNENTGVKTKAQKTRTRRGEEKLRGEEAAQRRGSKPIMLLPESSGSETG